MLFSTIFYLVIPGARTLAVDLFGLVGWGRCLFSPPEFSVRLGSEALGGQVKALDFCHIPFMSCHGRVVHIILLRLGRSMPCGGVLGLQ